MFMQGACFRDYMDKQGHLVGKENNSLKQSVSFSPHVYDNDIIDSQQVLSELSSHSAPIDRWNNGFVFHLRCHQKQAC